MSKCTHMYTHKLYLVDLVTVHTSFSIHTHTDSYRQHLILMTTRNLASKGMHIIFNAQLSRVVMIKVYLTYSRKKMAIMERKTVNFGVGGGGDESK